MTDTESPVEMGELEAEWGYRCPGCQTKRVKRDGRAVTIPEDKVRRGLSSESCAETLAKIHSALNNHDPEVVRFD